MTDSLGAKVSSNVKITLIGTVLQGVIQAAVMVVLARLLLPKDYGGYAIGISINAVTAGFLSGCFERSMFLDFDHNGSISQNGAVPLFIFFASLATSAGIWLYNITLHATVPVLVVCAILMSSVLSSMTIGSKISLRRRFKFKTIVMIELLSQLLGLNLVSIVLAFAKFGVISIVTGSIAQYIIYIILLALFTPGGIRFHFSIGEFKQQTKTAWALGRSIVLEVVNGQIPAAIIMSALGSVAIGIFYRAFTLVQLPVQLLTNSMNRVIVSALTDAAGDKMRLHRGMERLLTIAVAIITPVVGGIMGSAPQFTFVILGSKWSASAPLIPYLAISTWAVMIGSMFALLAEATRHFRLKFIVQTISSVVLALTVWAGANFSLQGASMGMAAGALVFFGAYVYATIPITGASAKAIFEWFLPGLTAGACCFMVGVIAQLMHISNNNYIVFAVQITVCGVCAATVYLVIFRKLSREILFLFAPKLHGKIPYLR